MSTRRSARLADKTATQQVPPSGRVSKKSTSNRVTKVKTATKKTATKKPRVVKTKRTPTEPPAIMESIASMSYVSPLATEFLVASSSNANSTNDSAEPSITQEAINDKTRRYPYLSSPTQHIKVRIERARKQRMFLMSREVQTDVEHSYAVLGNSQRVYKVTIKEVPTCNCPDHIMHRDMHCKHVLFVLLKVLRVSHDNPLIWQRALIPCELRSIFAFAAPDPLVMATESMHQEWQNATAPTQEPGDSLLFPTVDRRPIEGDCPVCYEEFTEGDEKNTVWCQLVCGNNIHTECFNRWKSTQTYRDVTCVYCRTPWICGITTGKSKGTSGGSFRNTYVRIETTL
ncbi:hypothetical protein BDF19DRAFT_447252 [Syncephalis fuscata]|nr:hypothetical protein BDF19DRAFT_447252 [Syncephalis fuscata]